MVVIGAAIVVIGAARVDVPKPPPKPPPTGEPKPPTMVFVPNILEKVIVKAVEAYK